MRVKSQTGKSRVSMSCSAFSRGKNGEAGYDLIFLSSSLVTHQVAKRVQNVRAIFQQPDQRDSEFQIKTSVNQDNGTPDEKK